MIEGKEKFYSIDLFDYKLTIIERIVIFLITIINLQ